MFLGDWAPGSCADTCVFRHLVVVFFDRGYMTLVSFGYLKLVVLDKARLTDIWVPDTFGIFNLALVFGYLKLVF